MSVNKFKVVDVVKCFELCDSANAQQPHKFKVGDVVKCVDVSSIDNLTLGKEYIVTHSHIGDDLLYLYDDKGDEACYSSYRFELSKGSATTPSKFKEGDMVYLIGFNHFKPCKLLSTGDNYLTMKFRAIIDDDNSKTFTESGCYTTKDFEPRIVLATEENRLMLNKLLGVEYEPLKLTGSDLAKKLLKDKPQTCYVSDYSEDYAKSSSCVVLIMEYADGSFISKSGAGWKFAVPCGRHGEVLDDE